jgi:hypothetical protein
LKKSPATINEINHLPQPGSTQLSKMGLTPNRQEPVMTADAACRNSAVTTEPARRHATVAIVFSQFF